MTVEALQPAPLPQVGAILHLDSALPYPETELYRGNRHWKLDGSCVLMTPQRVLTIRHILEKSGISAVFLPYEGIFPISGPPEREPPSRTDENFGDNLALVTLGDRVESATPLRHRWNHRKNTGSVSVCGYGSWPGSQTGYDDGLQQVYEVALGPDNNDHNLDISWSSRKNGGLAAGRNNSGGPMLSEHQKVIGIQREASGDRQICSWIGDDRDEWLTGAREAADEPAFSAVEAERRAFLLTIEARGGVAVPISIPPGSRRLEATLNATDGLRLQMEVVPADESSGLLERLRQSNRSSGRFLHRSYPSEETATGARRDLVIGVAPVASAAERRPKVAAQLCVRFV